MNLALDLNLDLDLDLDVDPKVFGICSSFESVPGAERRS